MCLSSLNAMGLLLLMIGFPAVSHAEITYSTIALTGDAVPSIGAGVNFNLFGESVINDAGQLAFRVTLVGTGVDFTNDSGIFSGSGGTLGLVAREGDAAPGTGPGVNFSSFEGRPVLNNAGQTAFIGFLAGTGVISSNNRALFSESGGILGLVAREGDAAPGTGPGVNFGDFDLPVFNNMGHTAFLSPLTGAGVDDTNNEGIFSESGGTLGLVARAGDAVPGMGPGVNFSGFSPTPVLNNAGQVAFSGLMTEAGVGGTTSQGIFSGSGGTLRLVARGGDAAPGTGPGVNFGGLGRPALNDAGQTAFGGILTGTGVVGTNNEGLFSESGGMLRLVAREGDAAPGTGPGVNLGGISNNGLVLNNRGQTVFVAGLTGTGVDFTNNSGLFSESGGTLRLIAREGAAAPGSGPGTGPVVNFSSFVTPTLNDAGIIAFTGRLTGMGVDDTNDVGIFATDRAGILQLIAREGSLFDVNPDPLVVENRTISSLSIVGGSGGIDGRSHSLNNAGILTFSLRFTDGTEGIFVANIGLPGDLNGDSFVGIEDLNIVLSNWNQNVPPANPLADPSGDGFVGIEDLNNVLGNWNAGTPPTDGDAIPEPVMFSLLSLGGLCLIRRSI